MILPLRYHWFSALLRAFLFATAVTAAGAAPLERDLGQGLGYVRVRRLPGDLPPNPPGRVPPCVIDVRYAEADAAGAGMFVAWLKFRATPRSPVFVLVNVETAPALLASLAVRNPATGIFVIGPASAQFKPDSPVKTSPADERLAYDALANGATVEALLSDHPAKVRIDEASLSKGTASDAPTDSAAEGPPPAVRRAGPPVDVALQRAVHLHRALAALKKV